MLASLKVLDTFLLNQNGIYLKPFHIQRTFESFQFLNTAFAENEIESIYNLIEKKLLQNLKQDLKVRLIFNSANDYNYTTDPIEKMNSPIRLKISKSLYQTAGLGQNTFKWSDRTYWDQLLTQLDSNYDDILSVNLNGQITETSRFNIFIFDPVSDCVYTPTLNSGCLNGVFRRHCIHENQINLPNLGFKKIIEKDFIVTNLQNYQLFVGNSVRGLIKAHLISE